MSTNTLENFSMYLWDNPEGYHITLTTNFGLSTEKRKFFSFGGQTHRSWRAFNLYQPIPLKAFFAEFQSLHKSIIKENNLDYWISKLAENTGTKGRRTAKGAMILMQENTDFAFILQLDTMEFHGWFDQTTLSEKQKKGAKGRCVGEFRWSLQNDAVEDYAEAF